MIVLTVLANFALASWVSVCPVDPINGACPEPMVWAKTASVGLTAEQFLQILPSLVIILLGAWGTKTLLRMIFNR